MKLGKIAKALVALFIAGTGAVSLGYADHTWDTADSISVAVAVATAAGVWVTSNEKDEEEKVVPVNVAGPELLPPPQG